MNVIARSVVGCCIVLALTGCGAKAQEPSSPALAIAAGTSSAPTHDELSRLPHVPDGRYSRVVLAPDATDAGLNREMVWHLLGEDGRLPLTLELSRERFAVTAINDIEMKEEGTVGYDAAGRMVLTREESGVVLVFDWTITDGDLILALVDGTPPERFIVNGRYTRYAD